MRKLLVLQEQLFGKSFEILCKDKKKSIVKYEYFFRNSNVG